MLAFVSARMCICVSDRLPVSLCVSQSVSLFVYLFVSQSVSLFVSRYVSQSTCRCENVWTTLLPPNLDRNVIPLT